MILITVIVIAVNAHWGGGFGGSPLQIIVVNNNNSGNGSLRQAIANISPGGTITFAANVTGSIFLASRLTVDKNLTIDGPGANVLGIEGRDQPTEANVFHISAGNATISGLRIANGFSSGAGGGVVVEGGSLTLNNCLITGNSAESAGGAFVGTGSTLTITNSTITGNTSFVEGGGVSNRGGTLIMINSTVLGNNAQDGGGIASGLFASSSVSTILNSTIANNAGDGGGLAIGSGSVVNLKNTIVAGNSGSPADVGGNLNSQGNNLIGNTTGGSGFVASDLLNVNPQLGAFANNGGTVSTVSLLSGSPAIDAGNNTGAPATDQRGVARPQGAAVDIGSYESGVSGWTGQTNVGSNVNVNLGTVTVTFSNVSAAGTTTQAPINPATAGTLPGGYQLGTGPAYDISSTASYSPPVTVCMQVPAVTDATAFAALRILHNEGGNLVDRTILAPDVPAPNFATKTICARVGSLSPFVIASAPAATSTNTPTPTASVTATATVTQTSTATNTPTPTPPAPPGVLDLTFSGDGIVMTAVGIATSYANGVAIQADGKIVAVGFGITDTNNAFTIVRYHPDGSLDNTFNGNGTSTTVVGSANAIAIQPDGKIVVVGHHGDPANLDFKVVRFNANGTLDNTFDGDGMVTTPIGGAYDVAFSVAIQTDGKIMVSGRSDSNPIFVTSFAMVRYNADGSLDSAFDGDGIAIVPGPGNAITDSLAIQADGKIVVGHNFYTGSAYVLTVLRYNSDGSPDTSFDGDGSVVTAVGTNVEQVSVAIQADGKIVAACSSYTSAAAGYDFWVVRYNTDGSTDSTFGTNGLVVTPIGTGGSFDIPKSIAIQTNGRIVVGGKSPNGSNNNFAAVRYNTNGSLDSTWGTGGIVTTDLGGNSESINAIAIQSNGRIVAAGESDALSPGTRRFATVRYIGDSPPPTTNTPTNTPTATFTSTPTTTPTNTPTATPTPASSPAISGNVTYGNALGNPAPPRFVSNVLISGAGSVPVSTLTGFPGGTYTLNGFGSGSYIVTPTKTGGVNGAVTSFDAARIAQHAVGSFLLTGNQLLVADASGNNQITSFDAGMVAKFAVGPPYEPPGIGSTGTWIFAPENRNYNSVDGSITGENYSALLMGEVSGNWTNTGARPGDSGQWIVDSEGTVVGGQLSAVGEDAGGVGKPITVAVQDVVTAAEKEVVVPVSVQGVAGKGVISYEFELRYDPSVIQLRENPVDVIGTVSRGLFVVTNGTEPGLLRVVVYGVFPIDSDGVLLNLRFTAVGKGGSLSPLTFERIMFNEGDLPAVLTDGLIEISKL